MLFRKKCGIDLGSDTIKIADKKNKKVVCEKNMIAVRDKTYVIAVGQRAYEMYEKTPLCVTADSPMVDGAIADGGNLGFILARLLKRFSSVFTKRPDILVTVPMELSEIEMRAFYKVLTGLKVRRIALVEKGVADAGLRAGQHRHPGICRRAVKIPCRKSVFWAETLEKFPLK